MTFEQLCTEIKEGTEKYGSRNAYLSSDEYKELFRQYKSAKKIAKKQPKLCKIVFNDYYNGFVIVIKESPIGNTYVSNLGGFMGIGAGVAAFESAESAFDFAKKLNYYPTVV